MLIGNTIIGLGKLMDFLKGSYGQKAASKLSNPSPLAMIGIVAMKKKNKLIMSQ